ncbi:MAG: hypothetical protein WBE99_02000 [Xanthobacteraceae bacterium]
MINVVYGATDQMSGQLPSGAPALARILSGALGVAVTLGLAIVFVWIGFGPGERHFTGSGAFLGPLVGRAMFGLFGLLTFIVVCWMGVRRLKRSRVATTGNSASARAPNSHCDSGPASNPIRRKW